MVITKAAIMYSNGEVIEGRDYGYITSLANRLSLSGEKIEGFVTSSGDFVLPGEAAHIAVKSGQVQSVIGELTPEDLWTVKAIEL